MAETGSKHNQLGHAIDDFLSLAMECCDGHDDLPTWLVSCLGLVAMGKPGAFESLIENIDNEENLGCWLTVPLLRLINDAHNWVDQVPPAPNLSLADEVGKSINEWAISRFPTFNPSWPEDQRSKWLELFSKLVGVSTEKAAPSETNESRANSILVKSEKTTERLTETTKTDVTLNTLSVSSGTRPRGRPPVSPVIAEKVSQRAIPTDAVDRSYLGEIRRAVGEANEPFTKSQITRAVLEKNPQWNESSLRSNIHSGFSVLERGGKIKHDPSADPESLGEAKWIRCKEFSPEPVIGANRCPIFEPATGKKWDSVQDFIRQEKPAEPHRVYRAIADEKPLDDGRIIRYVKGHGQRKPAQSQSPPIIDAEVSEDARKQIGGGSNDWRDFPESDATDLGRVHENAI